MASYIRTKQVLVLELVPVQVLVLVLVPVPVQVLVLVLVLVPVQWLLANILILHINTNEATKKLIKSLRSALSWNLDGISPFFPVFPANQA